VALAASVSLPAACGGGAEEAIAADEAALVYAVPNQFIAKQYTELLGRAPSPAEWSADVAGFQGTGCDAAALRAFAEDVLGSAEYQGLGYTNEEKLLTLYRAVLNREPDPGGYGYWLGVLNGGFPFTAVAGYFFDGAEFGALVPSMCAEGSYGFSGVAMAIPVGTGGFSGGTGAALQQLLDQAPPGSTVTLAPRSLTTVTQTLVVPPGVRLATAGCGSRARYASMGRLVRGSLFEGPIVQLEPGAALDRVWVSGQRQYLGFTNDATNIFVRSGAWGAVVHARSDTPAGWSALFLHGSAEQGIPCSRVDIRDNLVTGYTSRHTLAEGGGWSDGISTACEDAVVTVNDIVDPSDVGIVVFRAHPANQASLVAGNRILSAGVSAYGALVFDPLFAGPVPGFVGAEFSYNELWTGTSTHFDIGVAVGTRAWFHFDPRGSVDGHGGRVISNSTGGVPARLHTGIAVDGMVDAVIEGNAIVRTPVAVSACPSVDVGVHAADGHATPVPGAVPATFHSCIGH
jgi:hypothetical protein